MKSVINKIFFLGFSLLFFLFLSSSAFAAAPPATCPPGNFNNSYEQINPSSVVGYIFDSGEINNFDVIVGPGTTIEAATGDIEFVTLFFDWDLDGVYDYTTNDSCSYDQAAGGCTVNLQVDAPSITSSSQVYNGRAHLVYQTATTDPCADLPGTTGWGDIEDFTVEVVTNPPTDVLIDGFSNTTVDENTASGNPAGTLTTVDPDTGDTYIYTFVSGTGDEDNGLFTISEDQLNFAFTPDFENPIDTGGTPGDNVYSVRVETEDPSGNTFEKILTITINDLDEIIPVITLVGVDPITLQTGDSYTDAGATALDDVDGNITGNIVVVNPVNTAIPGTYIITYNVIDAAGNVAIEVTRTVEVVTGDIPVITLVGFDPETHEVNTTYTDAGATASDTEDGNITGSIVVVNPVDISTLGAYTVTYNVTDSNSNAALEVTRTVNVVIASDSDNDGIPDSIDPAPSDSCIPDNTVASCDSDNDGIPDGVEILNGTNPNNADSDGDGVPDGSDVSPNDACIPNSDAVATGDCDNDGTPNSSDPDDGNPCNPDPNALACTSPDSDGDGINDAQELLNGSNPLDACSPDDTHILCDSDNDGIPDGVEILNGTNPNNSDSDGDGVPDGSDVSPNDACIPNSDAVATGDCDNDGTPNSSDPDDGNPCNPDPNATNCVIGSTTDTDGDGLPDELEWLLGTNPNLTDTDGDGRSDSDNDRDTISPFIEIAAPNGGDANGDGRLDAIQNDVSSIPNTYNTFYNSLKVEGASTDICAQVNGFASIRESTLSFQDINYDYALGLWDFEIQCSTPGSTADIKIYLDRVYVTSSWVYRKYDELTQVYTDISSIVTYTTESVGGIDVTVVNYSITDGGLYDEDGLVNGVIVDPSGPAILPTAVGGGTGTKYCRDPDALNYRIAGKTDNSLCVYTQEEELTEAVEIIPETVTTIEKETSPTAPVEFIPEITVTTEEELFSDTTVDITELSVESGNSYTLKNDFDSCPIIDDINNPNYVYTPSGVFTDESSSFYTQDILKFAEIGIVDGFTDGSFKPFQQMTRTEFLKVALISHCYNYRNEDPSDLIYTDIDKSSWQAKVIKKAQALGMINGDQSLDGTPIFRPNDIITKSEAIKVLMRLSFIQATNPEVLDYNDITIDWHKPYIQTGQTLGLFDPQVDQNLFGPDTGVQRQDMIDLINRLVYLYR